jgi:hypothetical protein
LTIKWISRLAALAALSWPVGAFAQADVLDANRLAAGPYPAQTEAVRFEYSFEGMGLRGKFSTLADLRDGRFVDTLSAGPAVQVQGFDGAHAWLKDASGSVTQQDGGEQREAAVTEAYQLANLWWRADRAGATITSDGVKTDAGLAFDVLTVAPHGGLPFDAWFDRTTHLLSRTVMRRAGRTVTETDLDYRLTDGLMVPQKVVTDPGLGAKFLQTLTLNELHFLSHSGAELFAPPSGTAAMFIDGGASQTVLPFRLIDNHIYADVLLNGKGPFRFLFDTGADDTLAPATATTLGIRVEGDFSEHGAGEDAVEAGLGKVSDVTLAGAHIKDQTFEIFPSSDEVEGFSQDGIIGFDTFHRFVSRIDYGRRTVTLIDPKRFDPKDAGVAIPFVFEGNAVVVAGAYEGAPGRFIVDTGSRGELTLNKPFADRTGLRARHPNGVEAVVGWGIGGPGRAYVIRGGPFRLGSVEFTGVVTMLTTQDKGVFAGSDFEGVVGGGLLKRFAVTFDYGHRILYLKTAAQPVADAGSFDRAGMWFNASGTSFRIIDVTHGGPAEAAGLEPGDLITAVDGRPVATLAIYDLRQRLRTTRPGAIVVFTTSRSNRYQTRSVKLRNLIDPVRGEEPRQASSSF